MRISFDPSSVQDYARFLRVKSLPKYRIFGRFAEIPDEYASEFGTPTPSIDDEYALNPWAYDYQSAITELAIRKRKFAGFIDCGLGKTEIMLAFTRHAASQIAAGKAALIVAPLMVIEQHLEEIQKFYGDGLPIEPVAAKNLSSWLTSGTSKIGITNYDALHDDIPQGRLGAMVLDESSMLKSHYGKWGTTCLRLGRGLGWKLALTGTPAPNDRIEYANHAVFCDQFPTVNSFLARFFVNRGQTDNRWELKPHALQPFYRSLSHWSIFLSNPATYGWKDNCGTVPPIHVTIHDVQLTPEQQAIAGETTGGMFAGGKAGGITSRSTLSQLAKGKYRGSDVPTLKLEFVRQLAEARPDESTIIWCEFNGEQNDLARLMPNAINMTGDTPYDVRREMIRDFKSGAKKKLITKSSILGFGQNLQICTHHVFSTIKDSYEKYYQCVKRSNRIGSTAPLNVDIPVTAIERPMLDTVLTKAKRVQADTEAQEQMFRQMYLEGKNAAA